MQCPTCQKESKDLTVCDQCGAQLVPPVEGSVQAEGMPADSDSASADQPSYSSPEIPTPTSAREAEAAEKELPRPEQKVEPDSPNEPVIEQDTGRKSVGSKKSSHQIDDSVIDQYAVVDGNGNILVRSLNVTQQVVEKQKPLKTFVELTREAPAFVSEYPRSLFEDLESNFNTLVGQRIIVVSCYDSNMALAAAHFLVNRLTDVAQCRLLNFQQLSPDDCDLRIYTAIEPIDKPQQSTAFIVDATSSSAEQFLESVLSTSTTSPQMIMKGLRENKFFLVCIADAETMDLTSKNPRKQLVFVHWRIPFLETALRFHYPQQATELEKVIKDQRLMGTWAEEDRSFCNEISGLLKNGQLLKVINSKNAVEADHNRPEFLDNNSVEDTVLYAATYFTNLKLFDFSRVVTALLGNRTMTVTVKSVERSSDGTVREVEVSQQKPLVEIWEQSGDRILKSCSIIIRDAGVITFANHKVRDDLRTHLESYHGFYFANRFHDVLRQGLIFDRSDAIAENARRLLLDMMVSNPETYGIAWLLDLIQDIDSHFHKRNGDSGSTDNPLKVLGNRVNEDHVFRRLSQVLRDMLGANLHDMVDSLFRELLAARLHTPALELMKLLLLFTSDPREFGWLRNLIDQSDHETSEAAYRYLYGEVRKGKYYAYDFLTMLERWLLDEDRKDESYSPSNRAALRLLIEFSLESTVRFRGDQYGQWPVKHPLLAIDNDDVAAKHFELLARWLFHPGMDRVILTLNPGERVVHLLGALVAEWAFIIVGPPSQETANVETQQNNGSFTSGGEFRARELLHQLIRQIVIHTSSGGRKQYQKALLEYWEAYKDLLLQLSNLIDYAELRNRREFNWKRNILKELVSYFRDVQREQQAAYSKL
jgi:hypothetical protein